MFKRTTVQVDATDPFANDRLDRKPTAINLTGLVETLHEPTVLAISSRWGSGKTTFVQMWKQHLVNEGFVCVYFNAWTNDFASSALIPFIAEFDEQQRIQFGSNEKAVKVLEQVKEVGGRVVRGLGPVLVRMATRGAISDVDELKTLFGSQEKAADAISEGVGGLFKSAIDEYLDHKSTVKEFRETLTKFIRTIVEGGFKRPVVFFIDELDRCRPPFAIELLETVKHLFDVEELVFVLALDVEQLGHSIRAVYGQDFDSQGYLRRFIDLEFGLPMPTLEKFVDALLEHYGVAETLREKQYRHEAIEEIRGWLVPLAKLFGLQLRDLEKCLREIALSLRVQPSGNSVVGQELGHLVFLVALRAYDRTLYRQLIAKDIDRTQVVGIIEKGAQRAGLERYRVGRIVAALDRHFLSSQELGDMLKREKGMLDGVLTDDDAERLGDRREYFQRTQRIDVHQAWASAVEFVGQFTVPAADGE